MALVATEAGVVMKLEHVADGCLIVAFVLVVGGVLVLAGAGWSMLTAGLLVGFIGLRFYRGGVR